MLGRSSRGDTVIELVLAFAIFSSAAVMTMTILNQGVAIAGRSLEKSLVRQQIDSQVEMLRYMKATNDILWKDVIASANLSNAPMALSPATCPTVADLGNGINKNKSFFITPSASASGSPSTSPSTSAFTMNTISTTSGKYASPRTYARIDYSTTNQTAYGMWVQVVRAENKIKGTTGLDAYDFYIHACWDSIGSSQPSTVGTIVRLYEK